MKTPYTHIYAPDNAELYMARWWLFNAYDRDKAGKTIPPRFPSLPSVRIHYIARPDQDRALHDHPWDARTIILAGGYDEERPFNSDALRDELDADLIEVDGELRHLIQRRAGDTARLNYGEFHRISKIEDAGAWTMFITWGQRGDWGFMVDGKKVPHRQYLESHGQRPTYVREDERRDAA